MDLDSRHLKARKIAKLLGLDTNKNELRLLEIGCGSGGISHWFGTCESGRFEVDAVDVIDSRTVTEKFRFQLLTGAKLPFDAGAFDVVLSNHVIEHVGDDAEQGLHLAEIKRVLSPSGIGYLAVPNRWMLIEPHYRLAFLSWWPEPWRTTWLRLWRRGETYDCRPFARLELENRLAAAGFNFEQLHEEALRVIYELERPDSMAWRYFLRHVPTWVHVALRGAYPTLIYRLWRPDFVRKML